jgi:Rrf2 family protein
MRALVELALASGHGPVSAARIAKRQVLSAAYLEQLLHRLKKDGIVTSIRGPRGGYLLARKPADISMAEVVRVLDGANGAAKPAPNGRPKKGADAAAWITQAVRHCVHERLTALLGGVTLQDVCDEVRAIAGEPLDHRYTFHI